MPTFRSRPCWIAAVLAAIFVLAAVAGCGQSQPSDTSTGQQGEDTAAAVLQAYRQYGGTIATVSTANPNASAGVSNVAGTVPAYDLTQGNPPCAGYVQAVPSMVFSLTDGIKTVQVSFAGDTTTTLIVVAEGEEIICDKTASVTTTPSLTLQQPKAGRYGVWVGRTDMQNPINGKVTVSVAP